MQITYQATAYSEERVTGHYVRCEGRKGAYRFRVFETASGPRGPGMGPTLREYMTDGAEFTEEFRKLCITSKMTEKWK